MKISFKNEDEIKDFSDKQKLRVLITNRPALMQGILRQKKKKKESRWKQGHNAGRNKKTSEKVKI